MRGYLSMAVAGAALCTAAGGAAQQVAPNVDPPIFAEQPTGPDGPASTGFPYPPIQTLQQALAQTYRTNPALMAQRAAVRGTDSGAALARADGHPQIITGATFNQEIYTSRTLGSLGRGVTAVAGVEQVLFAGGRIRNAVRAADGRVIAGRADLRAVEGEVLTEAVTAYADLLRDRDIYALTADVIRALEMNLEWARSRLRVGDLTRTDVSQSEARLSLARSGLATAEGRLRSSAENFERVVGARPGLLKPLPPLPPLPPSADKAAQIAVADNADVAAFVARTRAAGYEVAAAKAERSPTISAVGSTIYNNALGTANTALGVPVGTTPNSLTNIGAGIAVRLPLYQGGAASARVRRAEEARAESLEQAIAAERLAVSNARSAFATWRTSSTAIVANESAVASNEVALKSVKVEQTVGARDLLDVLNAEQELLNSRISLASARRDAYVAGFVLLNAMGAAEAIDLDLGVDPLYDPNANYRLYGRTWSDWADGSRRPAASTRNVPEQVSGPLTRLNTGTPTDAEKHP